jgi:hypothetical protein
MIDPFTGTVVFIGGVLVFFLIAGVAYKMVKGSEDDHEDEDDEDNIGNWPQHPAI